MTEEERRQHAQEIEDMRKVWSGLLEKTEAKLLFWKITAIAGILFLLLGVLQLRGCIPARPDGWTFPGP